MSNMHFEDSPCWHYNWMWPCWRWEWKMPAWETAAGFTPSIEIKIFGSQQSNIYFMWPENTPVSHLLLRRGRNFFSSWGWSFVACFWYHTQSTGGFMCFLPGWIWLNTTSVKYRQEGKRVCFFLHLPIWVAPCDLKQPYADYFSPEVWWMWFMALLKQSCSLKKRKKILKRRKKKVRPFVREKESQNHWMVWVERDPEDHPVKPPWSAFPSKEGKNSR